MHNQHTEFVHLHTDINAEYILQINIILQTKKQMYGLYEHAHT